MAHSYFKTHIYFKMAFQAQINDLGDIVDPWTMWELGVPTPHAVKNSYKTLDSPKT